MSEDRQQELQELNASGIKDPRELLDHLNSANETQHAESFFRRGLKRLSQPLEYLEFCLNLASPLAGFDPIAQNAFGIIQSVVVVSYFRLRSIYGRVM